MPHLHPTALVASGAQIADDVRIGPYCVVGEHVRLGEGCVLMSHVVVDGHTTLGAHNQIFPFAALGLSPQDLKFKGERSTLTIGSHNTIREYVTMNPGTAGGGAETVIGSHGLFMVGAHVAHDCRVGDHVILANNATLAGHVTVEDHVIVGGLAAVHQFVRIGKHAMIGGMSGVEHDVIPYGSVMGERAGLAGLNLVGLKRRGFDRDEIHALRAAYKALFEESAGTLAARVAQVAQAYAQVPAVADVVAFITAQSARQLCVPARQSAA